MSIVELITLVSNRLATLNGAHATATVLGDVRQLERLEAEITETQVTLDALRTLG
jgi:hypothetical protein